MMDSNPGRVGCGDNWDTGQGLWEAAIVELKESSFKNPEDNYFRLKE